MDAINGLNAPVPADRPSQTKAPESRKTSEPQTREDVASKFEELQDARTPSTTKAILSEIASRSIEHPPRDIHKLVASASKYLLTSLDAAMEIAEEIRRDIESSDGNSLAVQAEGTARDQASRLLLE